MVVNVASKCGYTEGSYAGADDIWIFALHVASGCALLEQLTRLYKLHLRNCSNCLKFVNLARRMLVLRRLQGAPRQIPGAGDCGLPMQPVHVTGVGEQNGPSSLGSVSKTKGVQPSFAASEAALRAISCSRAQASGCIAEIKRTLCGALTVTWAQDTCVNIKTFAASKGFQGQLMDKVEVNGKGSIDVSGMSGSCVVLKTSVHHARLHVKPCACTFVRQAVLAPLEAICVQMAGVRLSEG